MQADHVSFGVLEYSDVAVFTNRHTPLEDGAARLGNTLENAVKIPFRVQVHLRAASAGRAAVHLANGASDSLGVVTGEHPHPSAVRLRDVHVYVEDRFVELFGALEIGSVKFEPIDDVFLEHAMNG